MKINDIRTSEIYFGNRALSEAEHVIRTLGKRALVVTGRNSADESGAYPDIAGLLERNGISHVRYSGVRENPSVSSCFEGAELGRAEGCDFVIAAGGGSAIDAGKAAAFYLANPGSAREEIFNVTGDHSRPLPLLAVPTTAGTGSEANRYSVLTEDGGAKKHTYKTGYSYPSVSVVCPRYTYSMPEKYSLSTALDAFAHSIESYLSPKSTEQSREYAMSSASAIWDVLKDWPGPLNEEDREKLSRSAMYAGAAIDVTGTGFPHPMGYGLTLGYGVPHGSACALFEDAFIRYNMITKEGRRLLGEFCGSLNVSPEELGDRLMRLPGVELHIGQDTAEELISRVEAASNFRNSPYILSRGEMSDIYKRLFK